MPWQREPCKVAAYSCTRRDRQSEWHNWLVFLCLVCMTAYTVSVYARCEYDVSHVPECVFKNVHITSHLLETSWKQIYPLQPVKQLHWLQFFPVNLGGSATQVVEKEHVKSDNLNIIEKMVVNLGMVPEFSLWEYIYIYICYHQNWLHLIPIPDYYPLSFLLINLTLSPIPSCRKYVVWSIAPKPCPSCQWTIVEGWFSNIHTMTCGDGWILGLSRETSMVKCHGTKGS